MAGATVTEGGQPVELVPQVQDVKEKEAIDDSAEIVPVEVGEIVSEPPTTRLELWSWYAYYFGNNSAGPLSYAPLSESPCLII